MSTLRTKLAGVLVASCAVAALGGCGDDADGDTARDAASQAESASTESPDESVSETPTEPGALPACSEVWIDGQDLPEDYTACTSEGETLKPVKRACGYGAKFLEQDGRFYAMLGNPITDAGDLETSEQYQQLLETCQA